jgi:hypothetical protein
MSDIQLSDEQEAILRGQVFDDSQPGALLHDFQLVLDHVGEKGVKAGGKYNLLPIESIIALDPQLAKPLQLPLERPQLRSHPYLQGLHLLLRASGLGRVEGKGDKARLVVDPTLLASWNELNPTERYFSLLEAWLLVAQPGMVGDDGQWSDCLLDEWSFLLERHAERVRPTRRLSIQWMLARRYQEIYNLALADLFGLLTAQLPDGSREAWRDCKAKFTAFGDALMMFLAEGLAELEAQGEEGEEDEAADDALDEDDFEDEEDQQGGLVQTGLMQPWLQYYFPAYQKTLAAPAGLVREGVFVFKVSLGREVWRRIAVTHEHTLDDLLQAILHSIRFDYDHLYQFTYRDSLGRTVKVDHPEDPEGIPADTVAVGTLPLQPGQSMDLWYDFGDDWRFQVALERIDPPGSLKKLPRVIESHGKAPRQYPRWD